MADMPTKPVLALVGIGAVLLTGMALIGQKVSRPAKPAQAPKVVQALPDAFDRGEAGLSAGAELDYIARVVGDWRGPGGNCAAPIRVREDGGALTVSEAGGDTVLEIGLVKPGVVRAEVAKPKARKGGDYEFSVGLITAEEAARGPITVARPGAGAETWEPCG
jgi:hypothetical protein